MADTDRYTAELLSDWVEQMTRGRNMEEIDKEVVETYRRIQQASPTVRALLLEEWTADLKRWPHLWNFALVGMATLAVYDSPPLAIEMPVTDDAS